MKRPEHGGERATHRGRRMLPGVVLVVLAALALVWFLPARWVTPLLEARVQGLQLQQVHGLLWNGGAERVRVGEVPSLGELHWQLSRRALLGDVRLQLRLEGPALRFAGAMQRRSADSTEWRDVKLQLQLEAVQPPLATPLGWPQGTLSLQAPHALLQGNWPMQLQATAQWSAAALRTPRGTVALGSLQFDAHAVQGTMDVRMHDAGNGPLALTGDAQASPLGWRLDARLRPRTADPILRRWLATLGRPDTEGGVSLHRRGGLAAALPTTGVQP